MGLQRTQDVVSAVDRGLVLVPVEFRVSGAAIVSGSVKGDLCSGVTYSAAGSYVVNLTDVGYDLYGAFPALQAVASSGGSSLECGQYSAATKSIPVRLFNQAGTLADPASANDVVGLFLVVKKTAVKAGGGPL